MRKQKMKIFSFMLATTMLATSILPSSLVEAAEKKSAWMSNINEINTSIKGAEPTTTTYTFEDENAVFTQDSRVTVAIEENSDLNSKVVGFTCSGNAQNGYSFAHYDFTELVNNSAKTTIEFDCYNTNGGRAILSLGNAAARGNTGNSTKITYSSQGAVFNIGSDKSNALLNGQKRTLAELTDKWMHVKVEVDEMTNTYNYQVTAKSDNSELASGTDVGFVDTTVEEVTQIDIFGYINNSHMAMIDNLSITSEESDAKQHTVTIKVVTEDNEELVSKESSSTVFEGVAFTPNYEETFNLDGYKYTYVSGAQSFETITEDKTITLVYSKRELATTTATLKLMDGDNLLNEISQEAVEDSEINVAYPKYIMNEKGIIYSTPANSSGDYFRRKFMGTTEDQEVIIPYTAEKYRGAYFIEGEDLGEDSGAENAEARCSGGAAYKVPEEPVNVISLGEGTYTVETAVTGGRLDNLGHNDTYTVKAGEQELISLATTGSLTTRTSEEFTLTEVTYITVSGTAKNKTGLDYILIRSNQIPATSVEIINLADTEDSTNNIITEENQTIRLKANVLPEDTTDTVTWSSSDTAKATVSEPDSEGIVTVAPVADGEAIITAKAGDCSATYKIFVNIAGETPIVTGVTLDKTSVELKAIGETVTLAATVAGTVEDKSVTWSSSDEKVVTVSEGTVKAVGNGTATVTAASKADPTKKASCTVKVTVEATKPDVPVQSITLDKTTAAIKVKEKVSLKATVLPKEADQTVTWTSSDTKTATVENGVVTGVAKGEATITAKAGEMTATAKITVTEDSGNTPGGDTVPVESITLAPEEASVKAGETVTLTATVLPEKADQTVTWTSSDPAIAAVENGVVTGVAKGEATITAKAGEKTATAKITVTETSGDTVPVESITLDKTEATLTAAGQTVTLTATVLPEKADQTVTWTSSDPTKATVENGVVTAVANGTATITATAVNGMHAAALVTVAIGDSGNVTDTKVSAITVTAADNKTTLTKAGETVQLTAAVLPAEAKDKSVTWASSNPAAAAVSETGLVTAAANGTAVISATAKDGSNVKGDLTITVNIPAPEETVGGAVGSKVTPASKTEKGSYKVTVQGTAGKAAEVAFTGTKETGKKIIIPNTVKGTDGVTYQVTKITKSAITANQKKKITEVKIPDNVKTIEAGAFTNCTKLTKVTFTKKSKLTKIDANTFKGCKEIKTFTIPGSVTKIGKSAFEKCTALKKIVIPDKVTEIGDKAFYGNKKMTDVTIGKKVTKIGKQAFYGCKLLKKVKVNTTKLKTVGKNAFKGVKKGAQAKVPAKQKKAYKNLLKPLKVK